MSCDQSPVKRGRLVAKYLLLHGPSTVFIICRDSGHCFGTCTSMAFDFWKSAHTYGLQQMIPHYQPTARHFARLCFVRSLLKRWCSSS